MKVIELMARLNEMPPEMGVEISYKTAGYYPDDSDTYYITADDVRINSARGAVVIK